MPLCSLCGSAPLRQILLCRTSRADQIYRREAKEQRGRGNAGKQLLLAEDLLLVSGPAGIGGVKIMSKSRSRRTQLQCLFAPSATRLLCGKSYWAGRPEPIRFTAERQRSREAEAMQGNNCCLRWIYGPAGIG
jgi:hypothetical protein